MQVQWTGISRRVILAAAGVLELPDLTEAFTQRPEQAVFSADNEHVRPAGSSYLESLLNIHQAFRLATSKTVDRHVQLIGETKAKMLANFPEVTKLGWAIITVDEAGKRVGEPINLTNTLDNYVKFLLGRNRFLSNFSRRRVVY